MTEKRFEIIKSAIIDGARVIKDNENKYTFATTFETATLVNYRKALNELNDVNEQLKRENKELRQDNDIKFWKLQCLQSSNNNQVMLFELSKVIQQGYEVSDKFKQYLDEIKEYNKEIREKHKRLFE